jgi:hypothetical protein
MASTASTGPGVPRPAGGTTPVSSGSGPVDGRSGLSGAVLSGSPACTAGDDSSSLVPSARRACCRGPHYGPGEAAGPARTHQDFRRPGPLTAWRPGPLTAWRPGPLTAWRPAGRRAGRRHLRRREARALYGQECNRRSELENRTLRSCRDPGEYFLRITVFVCAEERRRENQERTTLPGRKKIWKQFWPTTYGEGGQAGGNRWGADVIRAIWRAARRLRACGAHDEGEGA